MSGYKQPNNPFSLLNQKIKAFEDKHNKWREKRQEKMDKKGDDGLTNFQRHMANKKRMSKGESKFNYNRAKNKDESLRRKSDPLLKEIEDMSEFQGPKNEPAVQEYIPIEIGTGHTSSDWTAKGTDGRSLQDLVDLRQGLDKNSAEYTDEYARIQTAINAAIKNKAKGDLRVTDQNINGIQLGPTIDKANQINSEIIPVEEAIKTDWNTILSQPISKAKTKTNRKELRFPELGKWHYKNSPHYTGQ